MSCIINCFNVYRSEIQVGSDLRLSRRHYVSNYFYCRINVKNFHGSLTTAVKAQNDTSKTANINDTIFDRTLV